MQLNITPAWFCLSNISAPISHLIHALDVAPFNLKSAEHHCLRNLFFWITAHQSLICLLPLNCFPSAVHLVTNSKHFHSNFYPPNSPETAFGTVSHAIKVCIDLLCLFVLILSPILILIHVHFISDSCLLYYFISWIMESNPEFGGKGVI